jgi:hypothetical protein
VAVYDGETGALVASHEHNRAPVMTVRVYTAGDGARRMISSGWGSTIIIADPDDRDLRELARFASVSPAWCSVAFRADRQPGTPPPRCVPRSPGGSWWIISL